MAGNNDLKGRVDLDVAGALNALKSAQRAFRDLERASTDAGKNMSTSQRAATKAIIDEYRKLRAEQSKAVDNAIATERKLREMERNGVNARSNSRKVTDAKVEQINTATEDKSVVAASQATLNNQRAVTEEKRQQIMLATAEAQATSRAIRDEIASRRLANNLEESASRNQSRALRDQLAVRRQMLREQQALTRAQDDGITSLNGMRYVLMDIGHSMLLLGAAATALPLATATTAIAWERDFANVIRTSQATGAEIESLKTQFTSLVTTMPVNWEELTQIGTLAGQLGIAKTEIGEFTRTVAMFTATTDISTEDAATAFGRLNSLLPDVQGDFTMLGDAIAKVGVESVATESSIVRITTQIAAIVGPAGFSAQEVIGLSGALASVGVPPELSRGVITRVFADVTKAISEGGLELEKWGRFVGMSGDEFRKAWNADAAGTFTKFMSAIQEKGNAAQLAIRDLGITSVRDVPILMRLGNAISSTGVAGGLLAESFDNAKNSAGEMQRQYDIIANTTSSKLQVFVQSFQALLDAIGSAALPAFGDILDDWSESLRGLTRNLAEPVRLLGSIQLPFTVGDAAAFAVITSAAVAGLALLIGVASRVGQAFIAARVAMTTFRAHLAENAAAANLNAAAMDRAALANGRFNASTSIASRAASGFRTVLSTVTSAGFAAALIGISVAIDAVNTSLENVGSSGKDVANSLLTAKNAVDALEDIEITQGGSGNPWESMNVNAKDFVKQLQLIEKTANYNVFDNMGLTVEQFNVIGAGRETLSKLNEGFQELINAGNTDAVFESVKGLASELDLSNDALARMIYNTPALNALFKDTLNANGIKITEQNLTKLAKEGLAGFGIAADAATGSAQGFDEAMTEVEQAAQATLDTLAGAAAGFLDFKSAMDNATEEGVLSLEKFMENVRAQAQAQAEWQQNLAKLAAMGASGAFMEYLATLGPEAAALIQEFTANPTALAEAQTLWQNHGEQAATTWAANFQAQQQLANDVGRAFGEGARLEILAKLSAVGADIPGIIAEYNRLMTAHRMYPQLSLDDARAQLDQFIAIQNQRVITIRTRTAEAWDPNKPGVSPMGSGFNGGYFGGYAGGGYTGDGGKFDPAGVVHRGEFVFTKKATAAIGVQNLYNMMNAAQRYGFSSGGATNNTGNAYYGGGGFGRSRGGSSGTTVVELSAYDRYLLENVSMYVNVGPDAVGRAVEANDLNLKNRGAR